MTGVVEIAGRGGTRAVALSAYLDRDAEERARTDALRWIKAVRAVHVDRQTMRDRFTIGADSLWWFTELYLHKEQAVLAAVRTIAAVDALVERERPSAIRWRGGDSATEFVAAARAARHGLAANCRAAAARLRTAERRVRTRAHALRLTDAHGGRARAPIAPTAVAAFVHRAFVNPAEGAAGGERYIGRVLTALEHRLPPGGLQTLVAGPRRSFRKRKWWDPILGGSEGLASIEAFGGRRSARDRDVWALRHDHLAALERSDELRQHAVIAGTDCWPVVRTQLVGVLWLQWPWSVRAMDRAGAALDALAPRVAVTYAEAGGWGRALALESRRRGIPLAGIQHGFIYRHWLNYAHERDELEASREHPADVGFPRPALTLVFDRYAERHLLERAHFPPDAIRVVGSAERDALIEAVQRTTAAERAAIRTGLGIPNDRRVVVCATKFTEAGTILRSLADAVRSLPSVHMIIKAHPAEGTSDYAPFAGDSISVLDATAPLANLLAIGDAVVTVNSTVAVDALALGVPAVSIGQPNNLLPFVEAGAMLGADDEDQIRDALSRLLSDHALRASVVENGRTLIGGGGTGNAAENAARAILALAGTADRESPTC